MFRIVALTVTNFLLDLATPLTSLSCSLFLSRLSFSLSLALLPLCTKLFSRPKMMESDSPAGGRGAFTLGPMGGMGGLGPMGGSAAGQLSPYLNVDPSYLATQTPEYIFNQVRKTWLRTMVVSWHFRVVCLVSLAFLKHEGG